ncbi:hypothetical protein BT93_G2302 [Corymbia citriodora subsp. variegata]|nr:hypothetical protein BT93_G2302 [Corymbia citriodora subsp. variegata]
MGGLKHFGLLVMMIVAMCTSPREVAAAPYFVHHQLRDSDMYATLGVQCKCCDGERGECRSKWAEGSCSKLRCLPWKYRH